MKKILLKLNMAIVFGIVLFASISFAGLENPEELIELLREEISLVDIVGNPDGTKDINQNRLRPSIMIDSDTIARLNRKNVHLFFGIDNIGTPYLSAQYKDEYEEGVMININAISKGTQYTFFSISPSTNENQVMDAKGNEIKNVKSVVETYSIESATNEIHELLPMSLENEVFIFSIGTNEMLSSDGIDGVFSYSKDDGSEEKVFGSFKESNFEDSYDLWNDSETINISKVNTEEIEINGEKKWRYCFRVDTSGTYKININNQTDSSIQYVDKSTGNVKTARGGAFEENDINSATSDNNYVLSSQDLYFIDFDENSKATIEHEYLHSGIYNENNLSIETNSSSVIEEIDNKNNKGFFEEIEAAISDFIMSIAMVVNVLVSFVAGHILTLDDIIFNKFSEVRLDFFNTNIFGEAVTSESNVVNGLRTPITEIFNFFKNIVIIGYLIILIYVGLKIMLSSTTAKKKATYKETFSYWVIGLIILFFMPYVMKYTIALNEAVVKYICDDSGIRSQQAIKGNNNVAQLVPEENKGLLETVYEKAIDFKNGEDYMSVLGRLALNQHKIGYSIGYLVLSWQVITMLVYYYKRVFIIALLIMIFPLIAFTFVWDKLNDGKSQALSQWMKEFMITVFIQSFHAIVYVFITNTIYATITTNNADFILLIIASSFMFAGEDIIRKMFGGDKNMAIGNATQSGAMISSIAIGTFSMGARTVNNIVGKDGFLRKNIRSIRSTLNSIYLSSKPMDLWLDNLGTGKKTPTNFEILARGFENNENNNNRKREKVSYIPENENATQNLQDADEMIDIFKNRSDDPEELAKGLQLYQKLMNARNGIGLNNMTDKEREAFDEMIRSSGIDIARYERVRRAMDEAAISTLAISGALYSNDNKEKVKKITQRLRIEVEAAFPQYDSHGKPITGRNNRDADRMMAAAMFTMRKNGLEMYEKGAVPEVEWDDSIHRIQESADKISFAQYLSTDEKKNVKRNVSQRAKELVTEYTKRSGPLTASEEKKVKLLANKVAKLERKENGEIFDYEMANAVESLDSNKEISKVLLEISRVDEDIETLKGILALKLKNGEGRVKSGKAILASIDSNLMNGTYRTVAEEQIAYKNAVKTLIDRRRDDIFIQYQNSGVRLNSAQTAEARKMAEELAKLEYADTDIFSMLQLADAKDAVNDNKELAKSMLAFTKINLNRIEDINEILNQRRNIGAWANKAIDDLESKSRTNEARYASGAIKDNNPNVTILDVIQAAHKAEEDARTETGRTSRTSRLQSIADLLENAKRTGANTDVVERKKEAIRITNQNGIVKAQKVSNAAKEFAKEAIKEEGYDDANRFKKDDKPQTPYDELRLDGYSLQDFKDIAKINRQEALVSTGQMLSDMVITPITTAAGVAIGAAMTSDFMPLEEAATGAIAGYKVGANVADKTIPNLVSNQRMQKLDSIKKSAANRVKSDENNRLNAKYLADLAANKNRDGLDGTLVFNDANATIHIETDGKLSVTVKVRAQNAAYISVSENSIIPSKGWQAYQESVYYKFNDNPTKSHTIYIYVRDRSGNVLGKKITGIRSN